MENNEKQEHLLNVFFKELNKKKKKDKEKTNLTNSDEPETETENKEEYLSTLPITEFENASGGGMRPKRHIRRFLKQSR